MAAVRYSEETKTRARQLRAEGRTYPQIAEEVGASEATVFYWTNPDHAERVRERRRRQRRENPEKEAEASRAYYERNRKKINRRTGARRKAAARALAAREREPKRVGGEKDAAEVYSLLRRAAQRLDSRVAVMPDGEGRRRTRAALAKLHEAEDALYEAIGWGA